MVWLKKYQSAFSVLFLTIVACVPQVIIYNTLPLILLNDSVWYLDFTRYFAAGGFFPDYYAFTKPVHCMINYPIGYPLFLDLCRLWSSASGWGRTIVLCQHLLSLLSVLLLFLIGKTIGQGKAGFCAAIAYAVYLPRIIYAQAVMAESLFIFLSLLSLYVFLGILFGKSGKRAGMFLGFVTALSILTKPMGILSVGLFLVYFLISPVSKRIILSFVFSFALVVFSNFLYNWHYHGQFVLTTTSGSHLANRVFGFDGSFDEKNPETREIISQCNNSGLRCHFPDVWWNYLRALRSGGLSPQDADRLLMKASMAGIQLHPFIFIKNTWVAFRENITEEDNWIDRKSISTKQGYVRYLHNWSIYQGGALPPAEFESRRKILKNVDIDYPEGAWHDLGIGWIDFFDTKILRWKWCMGWVFMFFSFYAFWGRDRTLLFISLFTNVNLLLVALTEAPFPRYFESFVPIVLLTVFLSSSIFWKRIFAPRSKG